MKKDQIHEFQWDTGNLDKSYEKHGIKPSEAEEVFLDENLGIIKDVKHSQIESRLIAVGRTRTGGKILFVVFTLRKNKIRIISARLVNKKERIEYEKQI